MSQSAEARVEPHDDLAARAKLISVDVMETHAVRVRGEVPTGYELKLEGGVGSFEGGLGYRTVFHVEIYDEAHTIVANMSVTVATTYEVPDAPKPDSLSSQYFGASTAVADAYPYARMMVADMAGKIGLPPLQLDVRPTPNVLPSDEAPAAEAE